MRPFLSIRYSPFNLPTFQVSLFFLFTRVLTRI